MLRTRYLFTDYVTGSLCMIAVSVHFEDFRVGGCVYGWHVCCGNGFVVFEYLSRSFNAIQRFGCRTPECYSSTRDSS